MPLRPWHRLSVKVAALLAAVALLGVGLVGFRLYETQKRQLEQTLGELLLNVARTGALLIDAELHAEVERTRRTDSEPYRRLQQALAAVQDANGIATPIYTLTDYDRPARQARFMVVSRGPGAPAEPYALAPALIEPLGQAFEQGRAAHTPIYRNQSGTWITAFAPVRDRAGRVIAVLDVDYRVDVFLGRLAELRDTVLQALVLGVLAALALGIVAARRLTRPIAALTAGVARVAAGDLSRPLPVSSADEVGRLTEAFNRMLEGLRQRDFIRDTFGRYVSPEVAQTLLASSEALKLGGDKREVTILLSDLRGYTRFAELGEPGRVMEVLNRYLGRMTDIIVAHRGTINEFIGDAIFAIFGAPLASPDHAEQACACALAMQGAMEDLNRDHEAQGLPPFAMGIGLNTGEAVVGNIGSERRAKYAAVGSAVNTAGRVEGATVGGQILISAATYERVQGIAEVGEATPVTVKGLAEPLVLYELRGLGGRWGLRVPEAALGPGRQVEVALPVTCWVLEGKIVGPTALGGVVLRLGDRQIDARLDAPLPPLTNVRLRLNYPGLGYDSDDIYGKVVAGDPGAGQPMTGIRLTSVDPADRKVIAMYLEGGTPGGATPRTSRGPT